MNNEKRTAQTSYITDGSRDRSYFVMVPQLVHARCRDCYDFVLWSVVKMIAGEDGTCTLSGGQLATMAMMSVGKVCDCRAYLLDVGLLTGRVCRDPGYSQGVWHLAIPDLWPENIAWRQEHNKLLERIELKRAQRVKLRQERAGKPSPDEGLVEGSQGEGSNTSGEGSNTSDEGKPSPDVYKEEPCIEPIDPKGEQGIIWEQACGWLAGQLSSSQYETWIAPAILLAFERKGSGADLVLGVDNPFKLDWLEHRLDPVIRRGVAGVLEVAEGAIHVTYKSR